jgi:hypothetical protein
MMITIDLVNEYIEKAEKPHAHTQALLVVQRQQPLDPIYNLVTARHRELLQAAHQARLGKLAKKQKTNHPVPVDVQRYSEKTEDTSTLVERYTRRIFGIVTKG